MPFIARLFACAGWNRFQLASVCPAPIMDEKSINLWRQIEGARRVGKRGKLPVQPSLSVERDHDHPGLKNLR